MAAPTMATGFLLDRFAAAGGKTAFVEADGSRETYAGLLGRIEKAGAALDAAGVRPAHRSSCAAISARRPRPSCWRSGRGARR